MRSNSFIGRLAQAHCRKVLSAFVSATRGDFVVVYKSLMDVSHNPRLEEVHLEDETLEVDDDASIEYSYLYRK